MKYSFRIINHYNKTFKAYKLWKDLKNLENNSFIIS